MAHTADQGAPVEPGPIQQVSLQNAAGLRVDLHNVGASIQKLVVPTPGGPVNTVLGYPDPIDYLKDPYFMGSTLGRYANRIAGARMQLDGALHQLAVTPGDAGNCLHGGPNGFSKRRWKVEARDEATSVRFSLRSKDGDQGFPGNLQAGITYTLLDDWKLMMDFRAVTDATTVVNLANHAYFNLNPDLSPIDNHHVMINADRYTPVNRNRIPTGRLQTVADSVFDFRRPGSLDERLRRARDEQAIENGFDHNFILNRTPGAICLAGQIWSPDSGLAMKIYTTQPGLQFYTGQALGEPFKPFEGLCMETQRWPNSPNNPDFPSAVLRAGMVYQHMTMYEFSIEPIP
jgi:aldose 1-epimerase